MNEKEKLNKKSMTSKAKWALFKDKKSINITLSSEDWYPINFQWIPILKLNNNMDA